MEEEAKLLKGDYSKVFLGGFSQGSFMAINSAILAPFKIGGVIALSGGVFPSLQKTINSDHERFADKKKSLPFFIYHGMRDQVVIYPHAKESYD